MKVFLKEEIVNYLTLHLENWMFEDDLIKRELKFKSFVGAFSFMTAVALEAEKMDHHPNWSNVYNQVSIGLKTHSANGITTKDFDLAQIIENIYIHYSS